MLFVHITDVKYAEDHTLIFVNSVYAVFALESLLTKDKYPA